jgi:type IV pilus assembly protein PilA
MKNLSTIHQGFTLIELMIAITVLSLILMIGVSLSRSWMDRSQVNNAIPTFKNAVFQAQVAALRNPHNLAPSQASVSVCWNATTHTLNILRLKNASNNVCQQSADTSVLQSFTLAKDISIKQGTQPFQCISFTSAGVLIVAPNSGCASDTKSIFTVGKNHETANITLI